MQQKVALTAAHLMCQGRVADMGMGSGSGSEALAALYPSLHVTGVDVSEEMVTLANELFDRPNLDFTLGDIATRVFDDGALTGILNSSVLHHVTSFTGYDHDAARRPLQAQVPQLAPHGVLVVRDFLDPGPGRVWLDLPTTDGDDGSDPATCSSCALLRRFATEFRPLQQTRGFPLEELDGAASGWQRFGLDRRMAVEFLLRKDYRTDWVSEAKEEYTYFTQADFEACYAALGLRVLASSPVRNPWIVRNRFIGKFRWQTPRGEALELPATNYVIVGERVPDGLGVRMQPAEDEAPVSFLKLSHHRDRRTGQVRDLVSRPNLTVDAVPWFEDEDELFVLARMSYPRPILAAAQTPALDGSTPPGYITEPITVIATDAPLGQTIERALEDRAGVGTERIRSMAPGCHVLPSAGGLREEIRSMFVHIDPHYVEHDVPDVSGFSTSGRVCALEARQLLRAAQVGGLPDARLEVNVYALLRARNRDPGPWIAGRPTLPERERVPNVVDIAGLQRPPRRVFVKTDEDACFLSLRCRRFAEFDCKGDQVATRTLEYVTPTSISARTLSVALLRRMEGIVYIGLDDDDLPAAQCIHGNSELWVTPAWRLPETVTGPTAGIAFVRDRLAAEYGVQLEDAVWLGGRYHPSSGTTPEVVHPLAIDVATVAAGGRPLTWVPLTALLDAPEHLGDGHLRIAAERCAHALRG